MIKIWERRGATTLFETPVFTLRRDRVVSPRLGVEHDFYSLVTRDWVNVIAVTPEEEVVLVRQWRNGTHALSLEIPGGVIDPGDADPAAAALRELREETGYDAERIVPIGVVDPNPAILTNACYSFLAEGARRVAEQALDAGEDIEVTTVPLAAIPGLIERGEIRHALVVAAFYHFESYRKR